MPDEFVNQVSRFFGGIRKKAAEAAEERQVDFARGKVAGATVTDDEGRLIVEAGHLVDDSVLMAARSAGKLGALTASVLKGRAQDLTEKAKDLYESTQEGQEARALRSVDQFVEARRYVGRIAGLDVLDTRGGIIVRAGQRISEQDVQAARDADQLSALIYAAQQEQPPPESIPQPSQPPEAAYLPPEQRPAARRAPLPVIPLNPPDDPE